MSVVGSLTKAAFKPYTYMGDGTNHAWGEPQILMGGGVKGSELFDSFPNLELDSEDDYNIAGRSS